MRKILIVDDDPEVLGVMEKVLISGGYETIATSDPAAAIVCFKARAVEISLIISNLGMPGISGIDLFDTVSAAAPDTKFILCSGAANVDFQSLIDRGIFAFIRKPFTTETTLRIVSAALKDS